MTNFGFQVWKSCFTGKPLHKLWREHSETARTDASYVLQYVVIITTFIRWHPIHMIWNHAKYSQWIRGLVSQQVHFWWFLQMSLLPYVAMTTWDQDPNRNETSGLRSTLKVVAVNLQPASRSSWGVMGQTVCRAAHVLFYPVTGIRVSIFRHIPKWRGKELLRVSQPQSECLPESWDDTTCICLVASSYDSMINPCRSLHCRYCRCLRWFFRTILSPVPIHVRRRRSYYKRRRWTSDFNGFLCGTGAISVC